MNATVTVECENCGNEISDDEVVYCSACAQDLMLEKYEEGFEEGQTAAPATRKMLAELVATHAAWAADKSEYNALILEKTFAEAEKEAKP